MRGISCAALAGFGLVFAAQAQMQPQVTPDTITEGEALAKAAIAECGRLAALLKEVGPTRAGVTVEQALAWKQAANPRPCHDALQRFGEAQGDVSATGSTPSAPPR